MKLRNLKLFNIDLRIFDNTNVTTDSGMTVEMKTYYSDYLIDNATPLLVHDQFAQKHPIPKNGGKTIEFRKYSPLPKALTPLTEGVTPSGKKMTVTKLEATVQQYGDYIELSDVLIMTAIDKNIVQATKLSGNQSGETLDTVTREVLNGGSNVQYAEGQVAARSLLTASHKLTVNAVKLAVRYLKTLKAKKINGYYVAIIHPDVAYDLMSDEAWIEASEYAGSMQIFEGELGKIAGVRFIEATEAKIFHASDLVAAGRNLAVQTTLGSAGKTLVVNLAVTAGDATALVGRKIILEGKQYTIASAAAGSAGSGTITVSSSDPNISTTDGTAGNVIYPGEAGALGRDVYSTLILGDDAYGVTEVTGGGLQTIVKQLGSAGTADALDQRATVGWKAMKVAERLVEEYMIRVETGCTFTGTSN